MDLKAWDILPEEANSNKRPNRGGLSFHVGEATASAAKTRRTGLQVSLQATALAASEEFLKDAGSVGGGALRGCVPGTTRWLSVFTVPYIALLVIAVWLAIRFTKQGRRRGGELFLLALIVCGAVVPAKPKTGRTGHQATIPIILRNLHCAERS